MQNEILRQKTWSQRTANSAHRVVPIGLGITYNNKKKCLKLRKKIQKKKSKNRKWKRRFKLLIPKGIIKYGFRKRLLNNVRKMVYFNSDLISVHFGFDRWNKRSSIFVGWRLRSRDFAASVYFFFMFFTFFVINSVVCLFCCPGEKKNVWKRILQKILRVQIHSQKKNNKLFLPNSVLHPRFLPCLLAVHKKFATRVHFHDWGRTQGLAVLPALLQI